MTQEALARRITERGVRISQEMLSRYLHRVRPTVARPDVIRAMHEVLGRSPEELTLALGLHGEAGDRRGVGPKTVSETVPEAAAGAASGTASGSGTVAAVPGSVRARWQWIVIAVLAAVLGSVLTAALTRGEGYSSARDRQLSPAAASSPSPLPSSAPSPSPSPSPSHSTTECRGDHEDGTRPQLHLDPLPGLLSGQG
ncbi:helix-turn-helix domain-containing protein [Streptomyces sp. NPDC096132]|uniref:helix-turn-helix domain-containing protein n=1 Tax=Streptomyces sp. NPDC096132 TaxID=3366075 RepID=UPI0037F11835